MKLLKCNLTHSLLTDTATQCYDCNYAPSGYAGSRSNTTSDATEATEVGYVACALATPDDSQSVAITDCQSNKCFIRLDPNGSRQATFRTTEH